MAEAAGRTGTRRDTSHPGSGHELSWKLLYSRSIPENQYRSSTLRRNAAGKIQNLAIRAERIQTHHGFSAREKIKQLTPGVHYSTRPVSIDITAATDADNHPHRDKHGNYRGASVAHKRQRNAGHRREPDNHPDVFHRVKAVNSEDAHDHE
jgi:hypothetical protein